MADLPTPSQITDLASLLAPGLIISSIRAKANTGSVPDFKDKVVSYGLISAAYFAAVTPLFEVPWGVGLTPWLWSASQYFVVPCLTGVMLAYAYQFRLSYRFAALCKLHVAHHLPAAWDYAFESLTDTTYLLVTLQDDTQIAGRWIAGSFASSNKDERDLLLAEMWQLSGDGSQWTPLIPARSILICGKDIRYVEIFGS